MSVSTRAAGKVIGGRRGDGSAAGFIGVAALVGEPVINGVGEHLGQIRDLIIDVPAGRIAYAVLEFAGLLGSEDKLFAVPWVALTLDADNSCFILNVDKRRLKDAPGFDRKLLPALSQCEWADEVHRFYSAEPFWSYHA